MAARAWDLEFGFSGFRLNCNKNENTNVIRVVIKITVVVVVAAVVAVAAAAAGVVVVVVIKLIRNRNDKNNGLLIRIITAVAAAIRILEVPTAMLFLLFCFWYHCCPKGPQQPAKTTGKHKKSTHVRPDKPKRSEHRKNKTTKHKLSKEFRDSNNPSESLGLKP